VLTVGYTVCVPDDATFPILLSITIEVAPETFHCRVAGSPALITLGVIVKLEMDGDPIAVILTSTVAVTDLLPFDAVIVYVRLFVGVRA